MTTSNNSSINFLTSSVFVKTPPSPTVQKLLKKEGQLSKKGAYFTRAADKKDKQLSLETNQESNKAKRLKGRKVFFISEFEKTQKELYEVKAQLRILYPQPIYEIPISHIEIDYEELLEDYEERLIDLTEVIDEKDQIIKDLQQKIEKLNEEIRRLKDLPKKPNYNPNKGHKVSNGEPNNPNKNKPGGSKKGQSKQSSKNIEVHQTIKIDAPEVIPKGFELRGFKDIVVRDIKFEVYNVRYLIPQYYNRETGETLGIPLPSGIKGHFGLDIRSFIISLRTRARVPENKILLILRGIGVQISAGQLHELLTSDAEIFHKEKIEVFKAGMEVSSYIGTDETHTRFCGKNGFRNVICNELFTVFHTTDSKSRLNFLQILTQNAGQYVFNEEAHAYFKRMETKEKWVNLFLNHPILNHDELVQLLSLHQLNPDSKLYQTILEAGLLGFLIAEGFNPQTILHSDGAKQFDLFAHCLCWIHVVRPLKKIIPKTILEEQYIDDAINLFWEFYKKLVDYKENPSPKQAQDLDLLFDETFCRTTGYLELDKALAGIAANKAKLLLVLKRSEAPLHNNACESRGREGKVQDNVSKPRTKAGVDRLDTHLSLMQTVQQLNVSYWFYLKDRLSNKNEIPPLASLIRQKAEMLASKAASAFSMQQASI